ncbi:MAG: NTP transferase domain-containing protein, partial [Gemmobacter sp.]
MQDALMILILAGGASSRMRGADKLLERIDGQPQLARIAQAALATGLPVRVALPPDRPDRHAALHDLSVQIVTVPDAATGMAATIRAGAAGWPGAIMILPADMPEISAQMLGVMVEQHRAHPDMILRGASGPTPGHPV